MRTKPSAKVASRKGPICFDPNKPTRPTKRAVFGSNDVQLWGWPSRGGVIVLSNATSVDLEFLGWDPVNPPLNRDEDQDAEDEFCKRLLLLGAGWYDSQERYDYLADVADKFEEALLQTEYGEVPRATRMERLWVKVGWPSEGGLWVAEFDDPVFGPPFSEPRLPPGSGQIVLARNMDERCQILERLGGCFFARLEDYDGVGCLRAWEQKTTGEIGPLVVI